MCFRGLDNMQKRQLKATEFDKLAKASKQQQRSIDMARAVLVQGQTQKDVAAEYGCTASRVSAVVAKFWSLHTERQATPEGYVVMTVTLPKDKAAIVQEWHEASRRKMEAQA